MEKIAMTLIILGSIMLLSYTGQQVNQQTDSANVLKTKHDTAK
jgi:hypothetical protein